ncbi:hypothetical protein EG864_15125, partial [Enterococcus faecalis]
LGRHGARHARLVQLRHRAQPGLVRRAHGALRARAGDDGPAGHALPGRRPRAAAAAAPAAGVADALAAAPRPRRGAAPRLRGPPRRVPELARARLAAPAPRGAPELGRRAGGGRRRAAPAPAQPRRRHVREPQGHCPRDGGGGGRGRG